MEQCFHTYYSGDPHHSLSPFGAVDLLELLQHDLDLLAVGGVHRDKVKTLHDSVSVYNCKLGKSGRKEQYTFAFSTSAGVESS